MFLKKGGYQEGRMKKERRADTPLRTMEMFTVPVLPNLRSQMLYVHRRSTIYFLDTWQFGYT